MTHSAELFFSYRSPYSYLAIGRYRALAKQYDLEITLRPVWPIAVRDPGFFEREDPLWLPYLVKDVMRLAQYLDLPFTMPSPDPIKMNLATREIAEDQPLIKPITYLGVEASRRGRGVAFAHEVSSMIWGGVKDWNTCENLTAAAGRAGLDLAEMRAAGEGTEASYDAEIEMNQAALAKAGHWGVPTLVFNGEPFFGQDRIDVAVWRMKQKGLTARG
ncbi:MAG: 2-hydroxychromene-2-carboxylate isomerase [Pikeienuella sp.]